MYLRIFNLIELEIVIKMFSGHGIQFVQIAEQSISHRAKRHRWLENMRLENFIQEKGDEIFMDVSIAKRICKGNTLSILLKRMYFILKFLDAIKERRLINTQERKKIKLHVF